MTSRTPSGFRMAVESALRTRGHEVGLNPQRLQRELVCERLLTRLHLVAPGRWALKGGIALDFRLGTRARTTRDMDLVWLDTKAQARRHLQEAQDLGLGDYFSFSIEDVREYDEAGEHTTRYRVSALLGGRRYADLVVDINFGDGVIGDAEPLLPPPYLHFPELDMSPIPAIPIEQHVAEKVHAYSRVYASGPSSRVKDFVDLVLIARYSRLDAERLRQALEVTFATRNMHALPGSLPVPPQEWRVPYNRLTAGTGIEPDISAGYQLAAALLDPVLDGSVHSGVWQPEERRWQIV